MGRQEAIKAAEKMESEHGEIEYDNEGSMGRHNFRYEGAVHANTLPGDWTIVGFGTGWFGIAQR